MGPKIYLHKFNQIDVQAFVATTGLTTYSHMNIFFRRPQVRGYLAYPNGGAYFELLSSDFGTRAINKYCQGLERNIHCNE